MYCTADEKITWDNTIDVVTVGNQQAIKEHFSIMDSKTHKTIMRLAVKSNATNMMEILLINSTCIIFGCRVAARYNYPMLKMLLLSDTSRINKRVLKIKDNIFRHRLLATILNDENFVKHLNNKTIALLSVEHYGADFKNIIDICYGYKKHRDGIFLRILKNQNLTKDQCNIIVGKIHDEYGCMSVKVCREACLTIMDFKVKKNDWEIIKDFIDKKPKTENTYFAAKMSVIKNESKIVVVEELKRFVDELEDHLAIIDNGKFDVGNVEIMFRRFE
uniref:Uncharacterized protein n=1 Tax=viral metagenome TaxID=1070528 RepID=A0A6C0C8P0_9ZZZZ